MSPLEAAYMDLRARTAVADAAGDWQERQVLAPLADVADHVKRVGDHRDSSHYRADKAGVLVDAALRVQRETMLAYAGWPDDDHPVTRAIEDATKVLSSVVEAVRRAMWSAGAGDSYGLDGALYRSDAEAVTAAGREFSRWAQALAANAVADPEGW